MLAWFSSISTGSKAKLATVTPMKSPICILLRSAAEDVSNLQVLQHLAGDGRRDADHRRHAQHRGHATHARDAHQHHQQRGNDQRRQASGRKSDCSTNRSCRPDCRRPRRRRSRRRSSRWRRRFRPSGHRRNSYRGQSCTAARLRVRRKRPWRSGRVRCERCRHGPPPTSSGQKRRAPCRWPGSCACGTACSKRRPACRRRRSAAR